MGCPPNFREKLKTERREAEVQAGTFRVEVTATGKVTPNREVEVSSKASGEIFDLPFDAGDVVKKGDLLVRLDPDDERRNVDRSEASLRAAEARLNKARNDLATAKSNNEKALTDSRAAISLAEAKLKENEAKFQRQQQLFDQKMIAVERLDEARTALEQARTDLTKARAQFADAENMVHQIASKEQDVKLAEVEVTNSQIALDEARERLAETEVVAPMDGIITVRYVEPGQVISSALANVGGGTLLMIVSDLSKLYVVATVDEADIGGIGEGQTATILADAFPAESFQGRVSHIAPIGVELNSVVSFDVKIEVEGEGLKKLRPGMTADVAILTGEEPDTLWLQSDAVQEEVDGYFVEIASEGGEPQKVPVEIGITDGINTEIKSGIAAGQKVLVKAREKSPWER